MKNIKKIVLPLLIIISLFSMTAYAKEILPVSMISPWSTSLEFAPHSALANEVCTKNYTSAWINTFCNVMRMNGTTAYIKNLSTDPETGEVIYDSVSGAEDDYYLYWHQSEGSSSRQGTLYFNSNNISSNKTASHSNGGAIFKTAVYELDIKLQPGEWSDSFANSNNKNGLLSVWGWDTENDKIVNIAKMSIDSWDKTGMSWYPSYCFKDGGKDTFKGFRKLDDTNKWYKLRISVDVEKQTAVYQCLDTNGVEYANSGEVPFLNKCGYALTNFDIAIGWYRDYYIDNVKVTKEAFSVSNPAVDDTGDMITAAVDVKNYIYNVSGLGDNAPEVSPAAVLAVYDNETNRLVGFDVKTAAFENHTFDIAQSDRAKVFSQDGEQKTINLSVEKYNKPYTARVFVWNNLFDFLPYQGVTE